ncbi:MAG: DUF4129 domain-containing protein [Breznakibacter sp.]
MPHSVRHITKYFAIVALISGQPLLGQEKVPGNVVRYDARQVEVRKPEPGVVESYKNNRDYEYDRYRNNESLWDMFLRWLFQNFRIGFIPVAMVKYIFIFMAAVVFVLITLKLLGIGIKGLFIPTRHTYTLATNDMADDNIHVSNLADALHKHTQAGRLREATRIMYLMVLQNLDRLKLIKWQPGKTNFDYYYELPDQNLKLEFKKLVLAYEYVWYGEFPPNNDQFAEIQKQFARLHSANLNQVEP